MPGVYTHFLENTDTNICSGHATDPSGSQGRSRGRCPSTQGSGLAAAGTSHAYWDRSRGMQLGTFTRPDKTK